MKEIVLEYDQDDEFNDTFNVPFSMTELRCIIRDLKLGKSEGPDGIVPEMITHTTNEMADIFLTLFNKIHVLETGCFPESWSHSLLCPMFYF